MRKADLKIKETLYTCADKCRVQSASYNKFYLVSRSDNPLDFIISCESVIIKVAPELLSRIK